MSETVLNTAFCRGGGLQFNNGGILSRLVLNVKNFFISISSLKKSLAFTLAETLIVIGIIGVVASLTIPNLNSTTADKEKITKLKKVYAQLNEAFARAQAIYGPADEWADFTEDNDEVNVLKFGDRLTEFMKVQQNCRTEDDTKCAPATNTGIAGAVEYRYTLADGTSVVIKNNAGIGFLFIFVYLDGPNKKSVEAKNYFQFRWFYSGQNFHGDGIVPAFNEDPVTWCIEDSKMGCAAWVLKYDNMDYLKADESGKCNNSDIVLDGTTNTSCK